MSSSRQVIAGLVGGVLAGVFFGEYAAILKWPADGYMRLLQMTVFPYITISIVNNLGRLEPRQATQLAKHVGLVLVTLWLIAAAYAFLVPLSFPSSENASFFSTSLLQSPEAFDFLSLYVPSNPFYALANSIVPAIVLFSILIGVALMTLERKGPLLDILAVAERAVGRATRMVTGLMPYGLFAIAANAAGTLNIDQLQHIQLFLIAYLVVGVFFALWVLPGLIAALTAIPVRDVLRETHDGIVTATMAGDVFIVLPTLTEASRRLLRKHDDDSRVPDLPEVIVPTAYNLPHSGKLLSLSFILFAGWYSDTPVDVLEWPRLALTGLFTFFGSINVAVPFLLDLFRIPADTFQLFVAMSVLNSRVGSLVAAMHTVTVAVLGSAAVAGRLHIHPRRLWRFAVVTAIATIVVIGGLRATFATVLARPYNKDELIMSMPLLGAPVASIVDEGRTPPAAEEGRSVLDGVRVRGRLRVGYIPDALPYAFRNTAGEFVGHDVNLAHLLARELGVTLEFVPLDRAGLVRDLDGGVCDIAMSGIPVTTLGARDLLFSRSYIDETLAFVVPDHERHLYGTWESIRGIQPLAVSVVDLPYFVDKMSELLPGARVVRVQAVGDLFNDQAPAANAALLTAERGSAWTLLHPELSVVVPQPDPIRIPLAFAIARRDAALENLVNAWIDLKRKDGTLDLLYKHWILGIDAAPGTPRWSVLRNVLGWV